MKTTTWDGTQAGVDRIKAAYVKGNPNGYLLAYIAEADVHDPHNGRAGQLVLASNLLGGERYYDPGAEVPVP